MAEKKRTTIAAAIGGALVGATLTAGVGVIAQDIPFEKRFGSKVGPADVACTVGCAMQSGVYKGDPTDMRRYVLRQAADCSWLLYVDGKGYASESELPENAKIWTDRCGE